MQNKIASGNLLCDAMNSYPVFSDNPDGVGWGGMEIQEGGDTCISTADSWWSMSESTQYCKAIILQLKIKFLKRAKKKKVPAKPGH